MLFVGVAMGDNKPITLDRLPHKAQTFLKQHFPDCKATFVTQDDDLIAKDYEVMLENGVKIDFASSGEWQDVEVRQGSVPAAIIPADIASYVKQRYSTERITRIERDRYTWEVELSNGLELKFDKYFRLIDIDD